MTRIAERADLVDAPPVVSKFIHWLETTELPDGLFAEDVFADFTPPLWRLQTAGRADTVAIRTGSHPGTSTVTQLRYDPIPSGFVLEFEEKWEAGGDHWYCREMVRADVRDGSISGLSIYCSGDWDSALVARHGVEVTLLRP
jgi:hypothetical protein